MQQRGSLSPAEQQALAERKAWRQLIAEQRVILTPISVFLVTTFVCLAILVLSQGAPVLVFIMPSIISGALVKYLGRLIEMKHRVISSVMVAVVVLIFLSAGNPVWVFVVASLNFMVCLGLSRRPLSYDQEKLVFRRSIGKIVGN